MRITIARRLQITANQLVHLLEDDGDHTLDAHFVVLDIIALAKTLEKLLNHSLQGKALLDMIRNEHWPIVHHYRGDGGMKITLSNHIVLCANQLKAAIEKEDMLEAHFILIDLIAYANLLEKELRGE